MPFVHSLERVFAPDVVDVTWTSLRIEESPDTDGPFTLIDTQDWTDSPATVTITTATLEHAWFRLQWAAAGGLLSPKSPLIQSPPTGIAAARPSLSQVGALILSRTRDDQGNLLGTFSAQTEPTDVQVDRLVDIAMQDVAVKALWLRSEHLDAVTACAAVRAAMLVEQSIRSEQTDTDDSPYKNLAAMYLDFVRGLNEATSDRKLLI